MQHPGDTGSSRSTVAASLPSGSRSDGPQVRLAEAIYDLYAHVEQGRRTLSQAETATLAQVLHVDPPTISRLAPNDEAAPARIARTNPPYSTDRHGVGPGAYLRTGTRQSPHHLQNGQSAFLPASSNGTIRNAWSVNPPNVCRLPPPDGP